VGPTHLRRPHGRRAIRIHRPLGEAGIYTTAPSSKRSVRVALVGRRHLLRFNGLPIFLHRHVIVAWGQGSMEGFGATKDQVFLLVGFASTHLDGGTLCMPWCNLYDQEDETVDHLLATCVFTRELWARLLQPSGWG